MQGIGPYKRYKFVNGLRTLSGCLYCEGPLIWEWTDRLIDERVFLKCFHCGRMFIRKNDQIILWPYKEYPHLDKKRENYQESTLG